LIPYAGKENPEEAVAERRRRRQARLSETN
jgi:hypothetical protein